MPSTRRAVLIDLGGVLYRDEIKVVAAEWAERLAITPRSFLDAVYGGSDDTILIGRMGEEAWWEIVRGRLRLDAGQLGELRRDVIRGRWDEGLVSCVRGLERVCVVSNAWPPVREWMGAAGVLDVGAEVVLSCEVGCAKPDPRIFEIALERVGAGPGDALFIDDTAGHVAAAEGLGMTGHVHANGPGTVERIGRFPGA
ncbi:HAD-IA family hydrolase [Actinomadura barringtoniae]|uniref:HAD-IA family hydrolase n=1 Tax=Actinomadura barringtoniae TaxID=1427535 RepID=A0A939PF56_9ACTN|nr:HAD-IA family hydrolase [Actinomadura barringtoniae]MBO2448054.1 HAD-IA family hydrolase [Actinomadura barringtoniae]